MSDTSWTLVRAAAAGVASARARLADHLFPILRTYFQARWRDPRHAYDIEDAVQTSFVELFDRDGALPRARPELGRFRAFVRGVARNVALRIEERRQRDQQRVVGAVTALAADEASLSQVFDRSWAQRIMDLAAQRMRSKATHQGAELERQVAILDLRIGEGLAIRDIAARWNEDRDACHRLYRRARLEFERCLREVVLEYSGCDEADVEDECRTLAELLRPR
ncbi:MAG: sigma-70 family RNA polymerase sigma factor [Planctomycetes bacterium]|nr:sigma-70 family RNA polymerase sigma factor [Planctomycetota bacterium]MCB9919400.1 sigma-70 family RNA polymerase sigma factor [Planctomycetota bacterium]